MPDNDSQGADIARPGQDKARQEADNTTQGADNAIQVPVSVKQWADEIPVPDNVKQVLDIVKQKPDNVKPGPDNVKSGPDNLGKKKRKRRPRRKNVKNEDTDNQKSVNKDTGDQQKSVNKSTGDQQKSVNKSPGDQQKKQTAGNGVPNSEKNGLRKDKKKKRSRRRRVDRYYGRFCCRVCRRRWDSALVFTIAGTRKVLWKQRCKNCTSDDAWMNPYDLELMRCSVCGLQVCECKCEECDKLKHRRYRTIETQTPEGDTEESSVVDDRFEYCDCPDNKRRSKGRVGDNIDAKKPHLAHLCQKCLKDFPCNQARSEEAGEEEYPEDNEP